MQKYKDEEYRDYTINVYYDPDPESPRRWSNVAKLYCLNGEYEFDQHNYGSMADLLMDLCIDYIPELYEKLDEEGVIYHDGSHYYFYNREIRERVEEALEEYVLIYPISCYSHSGTTIWLGSPMHDWDSGILGVAIQTKDDTIKECGGATPENWKEVALQNMEDEVKLLDTCMQGEVYGYEIEDEDGMVTDSCWGYYGDDGIEEAIAQAKEIIDCNIVEREKEERQRQRDEVMGDGSWPMLFTYEEMVGEI